MKKIGIICVISVMLMIAAVLAGCVGPSDDDDDEEDGELVKKGNSWTYKVTDDSMGIGSITMTVADERDTFEGQEVMKIIIEASFDPYYNEEDGIYYGDTTGIGDIYFRTSDFERVYYDSDMTIQAREDPAHDWSTTKYETEITYTITGNIPAEIIDGLNYTLEESTHDVAKIYLNGTIVYDDSTDFTETKIYEVLGEKEITVPAGTFKCFEIKVYTQGNENDHTLKYFYPEYNIDVKIIEHLDGDVSSVNELESYSK